MNFWLRILGLFFILAFIPSCVGLGPDPQKTKEARAGLDRAATEISTVKGFDIVKVVNYDVFDDEHSTDTCYYARGYFVIGTQLLNPEALNVYVQHLQDLGWVPRKDQYESSKVLERRGNEGAVIDTEPPGPELKDVVDYPQLRKVYPNIIFLRLDYVLHTC